MSKVSKKKRTNPNRYVVTWRDYYNIVNCKFAPNIDKAMALAGGNLCKKTTSIYKLGDKVKIKITIEE